MRAWDPRHATPSALPPDGPPAARRPARQRPGRCLFGEADFRFYLDALQAAVTHYRVQVHAHMLMTNHVHLLVTPLDLGAVSRTMQSVGARFVRYVNLARGRTGTLWEGRSRACRVGEDA